MNDPREPLQPLDYIALAALAIYGLAVAIGAVWLLIQVVRLLHATTYGAQLCGAAIILLLVAIAATAPDK